MSEDAARMIAEVVPQAGDLATKADIARLEQATKADIEGLKSYIDSRLLSFTAMILVPMVVTMLGTLGAFVALVIKL